MVVVVLDALAGKILLLQVMVQLLLQLQHKLDQLRRQIQLLPEQLFHRSQQHPPQYITTTMSATEQASPNSSSKRSYTTRNECSVVTGKLCFANFSWMLPK